MSATINSRECEEIRGMLGAYALGALDPDERNLVSTHLATCPDCRAEAASYALVVEALGSVAPREAPPPSMRASVMASITGQENRQAPEPIQLKAPAKETANLPSIWRNRIVQALSAAAILLLMAAGVLAYLLVQSNNDLDDAKATQAEVTEYLASGAQAVAMTELPASTYPHGQGHGTLLMASGKPAMVVVGDCPPSNDSRVYRVWVALNGERTGVGTLEVGDDWTGWLTIDQDISNYDEIGVTMVQNGSQRDDLLVAQL